MELSEKVVEIDDGSGVCHEFVPVGHLTIQAVISLVLTDDLFEIPREVKNVSMFALIEANIGSDNLIMLHDTSLFNWFFRSILLSGNSIREASNSGEL